MKQAAIALLYCCAKAAMHSSRIFHTSAKLRPLTSSVLASQLRASRNLDRFCENLRRVRVGEPLLGVVDKQLGY